MTPLLRRIRDAAPALGQAERRVADCVQERPDEIIHMSMGMLAARCRVSDPTIVRFCRRLGFEGYQDFKVHLAQSIVPAAPFAYEPVLASDPVDAIIGKTGRNALGAIQRALEEIVPDDIDAAASALASANWTAIFATGMSELTAFDAQHKLQRLGLRCLAMTAQAGRVPASLPGKGEIGLFFSQSGATRQLVTVASSVRARGGTVLSVTAAGSPLASASNQVIALTPFEHTELLTPLSSRTAHQLVVNMLVSAIAARTGHPFPDQLPALDAWATEKL
ncbi:MurR/RpiR family transcriptional regulator [Arsenicitalea aurantiaca]|uniref:MurR/RpiR family transcriptional regulator n=1 Tax=Arsenicitalea aurantiaca TaxID=1783274 RepID=A0A433XEH8_9HYPH|nr:MurR/RpiR family transcriptional regulator [Arsenicitalea aurantiaca]RUT32482.1 MurR/RpiR family transcriptional regulator [Arsenicitalea aurantiaca]